MLLSFKGKTVPFFIQRCVDRCTEKLCTKSENQEKHNQLSMSSWMVWIPAQKMYSLKLRFNSWVIITKKKEDTNEDRQNVTSKFNSSSLKVLIVQNYTSAPPVFKKTKGANVNNTFQGSHLPVNTTLNHSNYENLMISGEKDLLQLYSDPAQSPPEPSLKYDKNSWTERKTRQVSDS